MTEDKFVRVPVSQDNSWFTPECGTKNGFTLGDKGSPVVLTSYWEALEQLGKMPQPRWRRESLTSPKRGVVVGVRWELRRLQDLELAIAANGKLRPQPLCPPHLVTILRQSSIAESPSARATQVSPSVPNRAIDPEPIAIPVDEQMVKESRERVLALIRQREGQPEFRARLLHTYGCRCAVTQCNAEVALEAAHIVPYAGAQSNDIRNGLLLRADIHTLFDRGLIDIDEVRWVVRIGESLRGTDYECIDGQPLQLPQALHERPAAEYVCIRRRLALDA